MLTEGHAAMLAAGHITVLKAEHTNYRMLTTGHTAMYFDSSSYCYVGSSTVPVLYQYSLLKSEFCHVDSRTYCYAGRRT